ncbi:MAG TPA: type ISP restriction/modification enzyme [Pirellulales bacterium]|nr:type ISP restriction/modification enzyme [Pirellulales bacterium]
MPTPADIKPKHKAIAAYYETLREFSDQQVKHEGAVETAFGRLLAETARARGWMLVPKLPLKRGGKSITPDGTVRDDFNLHRGYWEAKDSDDDLWAEIQKKTAKGYPLTNTIFEDTRRAVLFQNGQEALDIDLTEPQALADLLNAFYRHTEPDIEGFERAVDEFKERVPELAQALTDKIIEAHRENRKFQTAFEAFMALCRAALNPNLSQAAVDEMLVQHLLTERLIRKIFDNPEFTQRNVIAVEVEKVIAALVSKSFNRDEFLKSLDRFYRAIEDAARVLQEFSDKQHFLNTVYERFFQGYSIRTADTHGIVYTPQAIVDFMCASVAEVLETEFGKKLGDRDVHILDPCTGTGNFIVNLLRRIPKRDLPRMYREQLFANEVMLLPYYIAALNIEHAYYELTGDYEGFEGLCFVDTLDMAEGRQMSLFTEANTARVVRQKNAPITVIIGNPPYNVGQLNENDNNKNRKYAIIDARIKGTYAKDSNATLNSKLYDPYVKFFRWATDRLEGRDGIVCFVSNNSFVDQIAFDGMRKHLLKDFNRVCHLHLEGNVRQNPKLSGTAYNVFGIQVGVGITVAVRAAKHADPGLEFARLDKYLRREAKLTWLAAQSSASQIAWERLRPDSRNSWLVSDNAAEFSVLLPLGTKDAKAGIAGSAPTVFKTYSLGVSTNRDDVAYGFDAHALADRVGRFCDDFNSELDRYKRRGENRDIDAFLDYSKVKWSRNLKRSLRNEQSLDYDPDCFRDALYRPFSKRFLYFADIAVDELGQMPKIFPTTESERENRVIALTTLGSEKPFMALAIRGICDLHLVGAGAGTQCFPFYVYNDDGMNRRENLTDWALEQFRTHYKNNKISKWDVFYYVYGVLHHAGYREKFADNLKRELPRIPFADDFKAFADAGEALAKLHLDYEQLEPYPLELVETPGVPLSFHVEKMKLAKDRSAVVVNRYLALARIPPETYRYRLGNRSALEWVLDQYQVSDDKRSGIRSDPNRPDDPEYIVRLVGQIVRVSVETVKIVEGLPEI